MRAVWSIKDTLSHVELDIISPEAEEVLIRNVYVASNPKGRLPCSSSLLSFRVDHCVNRLEISEMGGRLRVRRG